MDVATILVLIFVFLLALYFWPRDSKLPPGPRPLPLIGNLHFLLYKDGMSEIKNCQKRYGDISSSYLGPYLVVTLNSYKVIHEALVQKADVFSARPLFLAGAQAYSHGKGLVFQDGAPWRKMRRFSLRALRDFGFGKAAMEERILQECAVVMSEIEGYDGKIWSDTKGLFPKASFNVICTLVFGQRFDHGDPEFKEFLSKLRLAMRTGPPVPVEFIFSGFKYVKKILPISLCKAPLVVFAEFAQAFARKQIALHRKTYDVTNVRDYVDLYIKVTSEEESDIDDEDMFAAITDLILAGTETTSNILDWSLLYMTQYPDIQKRCQQEIDKVVGDSRSVRLADRASMPYMDATITEILRDTAILPLGLAHRNIDEATLAGYRIPANSIIVANIYSALHDPSVWQNPNKFQPERFLGSDGKLMKKVEALIPFSVGPRTCLGENLAKTEVFLILTNLLQRFSFSEHTPIDWRTETFSMTLRGAPTYDMRVSKRT